MKIVDVTRKTPDHKGVNESTVLHADSQFFKLPFVAVLSFRVGFLYGLAGCFAMAVVASVPPRPIVSIAQDGTITIAPFSRIAS